MAQYDLCRKQLEELRASHPGSDMPCLVEAALYCREKHNAKAVDCIKVSQRWTINSALAHPSASHFPIGLLTSLSKTKPYPFTQGNDTEKNQINLCTGPGIKNIIQRPS